MQPALSHSKTLLFIQQLTPKEVTKLRAYLLSPIYNTDAALVNAFEIVFKHSHGSGHTLTKEDAYKHIFGKVRYNDVKLRHVFSDLNKKIMDFWAWLEYAKHPSQYAINVGAQLLQRDLSEEFERQYKMHSAQLKKIPHSHAEYYLDLFQLDILEWENSAQARHKSLDAIESIAQHLDTFYLIKKLQLCCEILNVQNVVATDLNVLLFDEIMAYVEKNRNLLPAPAMVYYHIINMLRYPQDVKHYMQLKGTLEKHVGMFPEKDLKDIYQSALNYCIKRINMGHIDFQAELFATYKIMLKENLLRIGRYIPEHNFKNVVTIALRQQQPDWAKQFIDDYIKLLQPDKRNNAYHYNIANYYFYEKEYKQALQHLQKVQFNDPYYALDTRSMMMKIYFELREEQVFDYHVSAFRVFLHRNKIISDYQRTIYKNLVNFTSRLMHVINKPKRIATIKQDIEKNPQVADLRWLNEKTEELMNRGE